MRYIRHNRKRMTFGARKNRCMLVPSMGGSCGPRCSLNLSRGFDAGALILHQPIHRRVDAALLVRHIGKRQPHLDSGNGAEDSQVVGVAEMTDAEYLALHFPEPCAERHIEMIE